MNLFLRIRDKAILALLAISLVSIDLSGQCSLSCSRFDDGNGGFTNSLTVQAPMGMCGDNLTIPMPTVIGCENPGPLTNLLTEDFSGGGLPGGWNLTFDGMGGNTTVGTCASDLFSFDCAGAYPDASEAGPAAGFAGNVATINDHIVGVGVVGKGCIETSSVDLGAFTSALISFDYQNESVNLSGRLLVDYWDGTAWVNILNTGGQGSVNGNFSALVDASNGDFRLRFCYDDDGGFNFGASIDNVTIDGTNTVLPTPMNDFNNSADASGFYPVGITTVTWDVMDQMANTVTCSMIITVEDIEDPVLVNCPMDITQNTDPGVCQASVTWTDPTIQDNCSGSVLSGTHNSGDVFTQGTTTVTLTATDPSNNTSTCSFDVTIEDNEPPMAMCQDITVNLDATGLLSITAAQVDNGSVDNCGNVTLSIDKSNFNCTNVGFNTVTLSVADNSGNISTCTSEVAVIASAICPIPDFVNFGGPTIADPCTCRDPFMFDEEVRIVALTRQVWEVVTTDLLDPANSFTAYPTGTPLLENPAGSGDYTLPGVHIDSVGYSMDVQSFFYPGTILSISNICFYPDPEIEDLDGPICLYTPPITLVGNGGAPGVQGTSTFTINGVPATIFDPMALGLGIHVVELTFDAGNPAGLLPPPDVGCVATVEKFVEVLETPSFVSCNDNVQVSVDDMCQALVTPDDVLDGEYLCFDDYQVIVTDFLDTLGNLITEDYLHEELSFTLIHLPSGNTCWGNIIAEDKTAPSLNCTTKTVTCTSNLNFVSGPTVMDNCDNFPQRNKIEEELIDDDICDNDTMILVRTWVAFDSYGNESEPCTDTVIITRPSSDNIVFPTDKTFTCDQYNSNPNIILPNVTGTPSPTTGNTCNYSANHADEYLEALCNNLKIRRVWTVLDWCTGEIITSNANGDDNIQIIKILDETAPQITVEDVTLSAEEPAVHPHECVSLGLLPAPAVEDNCNDWTVRIFTPSGEADYVNGVDGSEGGYIPSPGLPIGLHTITVKATDECGNESEETYTLTVVDDIAPVAVCDELTDVDLSSDGLAAVYAETFDDGSHDNCCFDYYAVRKMTDACGISDNTVFGESVTFCCNDASSDAPITVIFRAYDCYGNYNDCMVLVEVSDKLDPILVECPSNETINCDYYWDNFEAAISLGDYSVLDEFGTATFSDNCDLVINHNNNVTIDQCGEGSIVRTWSADDSGDNTSPTCTQTITVVHVSDWVVEFPADLTSTCGTEEPDFGEPEVFFDSCELIAVSYEDVVFNVVLDACYKIARTWTVINWCVVGEEVDQEVEEVAEEDLPIPWNDLDGDGDSDDRTFRDSWNGIDFPGAADAGLDGQPDTDVDADPWDGFIQFEQTIKVIDTEEPVFADGCDIPSVCIYDGCLTDLTLPQPSADDCSEDVTISAESDLGAGFGPFTGVAPGSYSVTYTASDNCGNTSSCETTLTVEDCKNPTPYCVQGLVIELMNTVPPMVDIWAADFDAGSFDNCPGGVSISFSPDITDTQMIFNCNHVGAQIVQIWVTDAAGNQDFCTGIVEIQDNMAECGVPNIVLAGNISNEDGEDVEEVMIDVNGNVNTTMTTDASGDYEFSLPNGGDYSIVPSKDIDPLNGVTTFDLVKISKHILNVDPLDSPYKMIAADANRSNSITTFDLVTLRKLILFIDTEFQNNTSWRFIDASYEFSNPANPFEEAFPEVINLNNVDQDTYAQDFVAIKVGDVNGSAAANQLIATDDRSFEGRLDLLVENQLLQANTIQEVKIKAPQFNHFGLQFTMEFDTDLLEIIDIKEGLLREGNFGLHLLKEGYLTTSWNDSKQVALNQEEALFTLLVRSRKNVDLSEVLSLSSKYTQSEAYNSEEATQNIQLIFNESEFDYALYQNTPNPFSETTKIGFYLPESGEIAFQITSVSGKVLYELKKEFEKGHQEIVLSKDMLDANGVLFYHLKVNDFVASRKMVVIK